jgi:hypothetical protein
MLNKRNSHAYWSIMKLITSDFYVYYFCLRFKGPDFSFLLKVIRGDNGQLKYSLYDLRESVKTVSCFPFSLAIYNMSSLWHMFKAPVVNTGLYTDCLSCRSMNNIASASDTTSHRKKVSYCTMFGITWSLLTSICTCYATEDAIRVVNSFITIFTHTSLQSQLFLTLLRVYKIIILTRQYSILS